MMTCEGAVVYISPSKVLYELPFYTINSFKRIGEVQLHKRVKNTIVTTTTVMRHVVTWQLSFLKSMTYMRLHSGDCAHSNAPFLPASASCLLPTPTLHSKLVAISFKIPATTCVPFHPACKSST